MVSLASLTTVLVSGVSVGAEGAPTDSPSESTPLAFYKTYFDAESGSEEEEVALRALESILSGDEAAQQAQMLSLHRQLAEQRLGSEAITAYIDYFEAEPGSAEENEARTRFERLAKARGYSAQQGEQLAFPLAAADLASTEQVLPRPPEQSSTLDGVKMNQIGEDVPLEAIEVDVELRPSRSKVVAGELWSVVGEVENRSKQTIWIVNRFSMLTLPPELWGQLSLAGSMAAFFPTVFSRPNTDEIIRIEPGKSYFINWKLDTRMGQQREPENLIDRVLDIVHRVGNAWTEHLFFVPGEYIVSANVHVWPTPPRLEGGKVVNPGESITQSTSIEVSVEASQWVLIFGAIVGGMLAFLLQLLHGVRGVFDGRFVSHGRSRRFVTVLVGLGSALLLTSIVTILLSRLSSADFLINVEVRDVWGALATGFVIQWWGFAYIAKVLPVDKPSESRRGDAETASKAARGEPESGPASAPVSVIETPRSIE
jgi:hypothetical protein